MKLHYNSSLFSFEPPLDSPSDDLIEGVTDQVLLMNQRPVNSDIRPHIKQQVAALVDVIDEHEGTDYVAAQLGVMTNRVVTVESL